MQERGLGWRLSSLPILVSCIFHGTQGEWSSWTSSNIRSSLPWNLLPAIIAGPLPRALTTRWLHSMAREGLNTQWRPVVGQQGNQACHPSMLSGWRSCPCYLRPEKTWSTWTLHMDIAKWSVPKSDWLYSLQLKMEKFYTVRKTRLGADCGSDHKHLIAKFKQKLKSVGKNH